MFGNPDNLGDYVTRTLDDNHVPNACAQTRNFIGIVQCRTRHNNATNINRF